MRQIILQNLMQNIFFILPRYYNNSGYDLYQKVKSYVIKKIKLNLKEKSDLLILKDRLFQLIQDKCSYFNCDDLIFVSEYIREIFCKKIYPKEHIFLMSELNEIALIIQKVIVLRGNNFSNNPISKKNKKLDELFEMIKIYNILQQRIDFISVLNEPLDINIVLNPIKSKELDLYFEDYKSMYVNIKVEEDNTIFNPSLKEYLDRKNLSPGGIGLKASYALSKVFGFNFQDLNIIINNIDILNSHFIIKDQVIIAKDEFINKFVTLLGKDKFLCIYNFFSINHLTTKNTDITARHIELRCLTEMNGYVSFGKYTFLECINIFKNISLSGHFPNELLIDENSKRVFSKFQENISKFLSYKLGDLLEYNGYILPKEPDMENIICVDIKKFKNKNNKVIAFNDIDVLAINPTSKIVYNIELKYYKVAIDYRELKFDKIENKVFNQVMLRERLLWQHLPDILSIFFNLTDITGFSVKSIIITARPNYRATISSNSSITYYTWNTAVELISRKEF